MKKQQRVKLVVISLFDGMSGAKEALKHIPHIELLRFYSSEVDKDAIQVANNRHPEDIKYRLGSVIDINPIELLKEIYKAFGKDVKILLIGGSPCQGFSLAGKMKGSSTSCGIDVTTLKQYLRLKEEGFKFDGQSYLFWEYIRIKEAIKPSYFFLENVKVTQKWLPMFNEAVQVVSPYDINSILVSAQSRPRYYWTNIPDISKIKEKHIEVKDILQRRLKNKLIKKAVKDKGFYIDKSVPPSVSKNIENQHHNITHSNKHVYNMACTSGFQDNVISLKKAPCLRASNNATFFYHKNVYSKFTPLEWERLQTYPDGYTEGVSKTARYKMLGNSFTVEIIRHFLSHITPDSLPQKPRKKLF